MPGASPPGLGLTIAQIVNPDGQEALQAARAPAVPPACPGALPALRRPAGGGRRGRGRAEPSEQVRSVLWDSIVKEVQRRGTSVPAVQALFERVMRSLGAKVSWSKMAREMAMPLGARRRSGSGKTDPRTLQSYVEFLAVNYFALILYFWKPDSGSGEIAKDKKVYFGDPLLHTVTAERVGLPRDTHADIENAVALALYRRYEPTERSAENMLAPERLHVWGTRRGGEIDFVCGPRDAIEVVEVADWETVNRQKATAPARALPGRPALVATRNELEFGSWSNLVPAALLLWALSQ